MATWLMRIKRGSTLRVPFTITDSQGIPVSFASASFRFVPENNSPPEFQLTVGSGVIQPSYVWRGQWNAATSYILGDVVAYGDRYYRATVPNTNIPPRGSASWELFAQFILLLSATETASYSWNAGEYHFDVVFGNGDVELSYIKGPIKVTDD